MTNIIDLTDLRDDTIDQQTLPDDFEEIYELDEIQFTIETNIKIYHHKEQKYKICVSDEHPEVHYITPLAMSIVLDDIYAFDLLLKACPDDINDQILMDLTHTEEEGYTPLHFAVYHAIPYFVSELLKAGANPNLQNGKGQTPIMIPFDDHISDQNLDNVTEILQILIHYDADLLQTDNYGNTLMHYVVDDTYHHPLHFAQMLLNAGYHFEFNRNEDRLIDIRKK